MKKYILAIIAMIILLIIYAIYKHVGNKLQFARYDNIKKSIDYEMDGKTQTVLLKIGQSVAINNKYSIGPLMTNGEITGAVITDIKGNVIEKIGSGK